MTRRTARITRRRERLKERLTAIRDARVVRPVTLSAALVAAFSRASEARGYRVFDAAVRRP